MLKWATLGAMMLAFAPTIGWAEGYHPGAVEIGGSGSYAKQGSAELETSILSLQPEFRVYALRWLALGPVCMYRRSVRELKQSGTELNRSTTLSWGAETHLVAAVTDDVGGLAPFLRFAHVWDGHEEKALHSGLGGDYEASSSQFIFGLGAVPCGKVLPNQSRCRFLVDNRFGTEG